MCLMHSVCFVNCSVGSTATMLCDPVKISFPPFMLLVGFNPGPTLLRHLIHPL